MNPLELLLRLAKIREDQAMARARRATGQVNQAQALQNQVLEYAKDYENQIMNTSINENIQRSSLIPNHLKKTINKIDKQMTEDQEIFIPNANNFLNGSCINNNNQNSATCINLNNELTRKLLLLD